MSDCETVDGSYVSDSDAEPDTQIPLPMLPAIGNGELLLLCVLGRSLMIG